MSRSALLACFTTLLCAAPASAAPDSAPRPFPAIAGTVHDALVEGSTAYFAGGISGVGRPAGPLTLLGGDGAVRRLYPDLTSDGAGEGTDLGDARAALEIYALAPDGAGGFFVGGEFDSVAGERRSGLAHLRADGSLDPAFVPGVSGVVYALQRVGDVLFVGGAFGTNVAALDARTGAALAWGPGGRATGQVRSLSVSGDRVFIGGEFTSVAGETRRGAAALDRATGRLLAWDPKLDEPGSVYAIAARDGRVFLSGKFDEVQGTDVNDTALVSADDSATLSSWRAPGDADHIVLGSRAAVLLGDWYDDEDVELKAFDVATGAPLPWFGAVASDASAIALDGETLYVSTFKSGVVAFDLLTGARLPYSGAAIGTVLGAGGGAVAAGRIGGSTIDVVPRTGFVAMDVDTGELLPFDPKIAGTVETQWPNRIGPGLNALLRVGDTLFLGGAFTSVGGNAQMHLAAVDAATGAWRPGLPSASGGEVRALAVHGSTLYVGGEFKQLGGREVFKLGAIDLTTGQVLDWDAPYTSCPVYSLAVVGGRLLVGTCELRVYDAATRAPISTSGQPAGAVLAIEPDGAGGAWLGGTFEGRLRHVDSNLAQVPAPAVTGGTVESLALDGTELFVGGGFHSIAGQPRWGLGSIDVTTGQATSFRPEPDRGPSFLLALGGRVFASGNFTFMTHGAINHFARFGPTGPIASPTPTATPIPTAAPAVEPTPPPAASPAPRAQTLSPVRPARVTATLLRDGRVRLRAERSGTVVVRVRDKKTKRVVARRTLKVVKGTKTVRVGKARRGVYVEVVWR